MQKNVCKEERAARDIRDNHKQAHKYVAFNRQCRFLFSYFKCPHPRVSTKNRSDMADATVSLKKVIPAGSCRLHLTDSSLTCLLFFFFPSFSNHKMHSMFCTTRFAGAWMHTGKRQFPWLYYTVQDKCEAFMTGPKLNLCSLWTIQRHTALAGLLSSRLNSIPITYLWLRIPVGCISGLSAFKGYANNTCQRLSILAQWLQLKEWARVLF